MKYPRFEIWKNGKLITECQKDVTVLTRLLKIPYNKDTDKILITDTTTWLCKDRDYYIPS